MSHIYWELKEIPIPKFALVNRNDARVYMTYKGPNGERRRKVIGRATSATHMHPNGSFKFEYPELWSQFYGDQGLAEHIVKTGLYAATLAIAQRTGLYQDVSDAFGPLYGNGIMDYAMFSIAERSSSTQLFEDSMALRMLFSKNRPTDSWFSQLFSRFMTPEAVHRFKINHIQRCAKGNTQKVWLCVDGSNNDCVVHDSDLAEFGKAKSGKQVPIVSYIWAVNAQDGTPVTWSVNRGGVVDAVAIREIVDFVGHSGMTVEGVIVDRGFCSQELLNLLEELKLRYVLMLKGNHKGFREMLNDHLNEVRWKVENVFTDDGIFGVTDHKPIFESSTKTHCIGLYFDANTGTVGSLRLIKKVRQEARRLQAALACGRTATVEQPLRKYLEIVEENGIFSVSYKTQAWQKAVESKGFFAIAASDDLSAEEIYRLYQLRDASEKQFAIFKSELGMDALGVHSDESIRNKFAVAFVASILRSEIMRSCRQLDRNTNQVIRQLDHCMIKLMPDESYRFIDNLKADDKMLYAKWGLHVEHFRYLAQTLGNQDAVAQNSQVRHLPEVVQETPPRRGRPPKPKSDEPEKPKRKPGRPKGSKNKKTLEREATMADMPEAPKRKPGRPKGSKNKKTLEREALLAQSLLPKRGPGRPKGSKNKKTLELENAKPEPKSARVSIRRRIKNE